MAVLHKPGTVNSASRRVNTVRRPLQLACAVSRPNAAVDMSIRLPAALLTATTCYLLTVLPAAADVGSSFSLKCAGCHQNGGNIVKAGATLFTADLEKNGMLDRDALYRLIYYGQQKMPGFGQDCAPKGQCTFAARLSDQEVADMADYVLQRAAENWK